MNNKLPRLWPLMFSFFNKFEKAIFTEGLLISLMLLTIPVPLIKGLDGIIAY
jgi:hypothetical protein